MTDDIERYLEGGMKWKKYWNKPLLLILLITGSMTLILCVQPWVGLSENIWAMLLFYTGGALGISGILAGHYFLGGLFAGTFSIAGDALGPGAGGGSMEDLGKERRYFLKLKIDPLTMRKVKRAIIDRFGEPRKQIETKGSIKIKYRPPHSYYYGKRKGELIIYRGNYDRKALEDLYYNLFLEVKKKNNDDN